MYSCYRFLIVLLLSVAVAKSQARIDGTGRPMLVMDGNASWTQPTLVAKVGNEELYVPDMGRIDWVRNCYQYVGAYNMFTVLIYTYNSNTHALHGQIVEVYLEKKTASIYDFGVPNTAPVVISLSSSSLPIARALNDKIIPTVKREIAAYHHQLWYPHSPVDDIGTYSSATH